MQVVPLQSNFSAIRSWNGWNVCRSQKSQTHSQKPLFLRSRSYKVFGANEKPVYDFLLVIRPTSNIGPISHRFWNTAA